MKKPVLNKPIQQGQAKTWDIMTRAEKDVFEMSVKWGKKTLKECSRSELLAAIMHLGGQVVMAQERIEAAEKNTMKGYLRNRFYFRGRTTLGIINTVLAFLFNRVLVRYVDEQNRTLKWEWKYGTDFPPSAAV